MPLTLTFPSKAKKVTGCAVTYRAGERDEYATCPNTCPMMPQPHMHPITGGYGIRGATRVDTAYLDALLASVPQDGQAFTFTHFHPSTWHAQAPLARARHPRTTTLNYSADTPEQAIHAHHHWRVPTTLAVPLDLAARWRGRRLARLRDVAGARPSLYAEPADPVTALAATTGPATRDQLVAAWRATIIRDATGRTLRVLRCPAEWHPRVNCLNCGGGVGSARGGPLCARTDRSFAVGFTAHGPRRHRVGATGPDGAPAPGGCYASVGPSSLVWRRTVGRRPRLLPHRVEVTGADTRAIPDPDALQAWAEQLPRGTLLRHHVAGDIGRDCT